MKVKLATLGVTIPALLALSVSPASSTTVHPAEVEATAKASGEQFLKLDGNIGCWYRANDPDFLTVGDKKLWATVQITRCTPKPPDKCHLTISLANPVLDVAHKDAGWTGCKKMTLKVSHPCADLFHKRDYMTVGSLAMVYKGRTQSHVFHSKQVSKWCN